MTRLVQKIAVALLGATVLAACDSAGMAGGLSFLDTSGGRNLAVPSAQLADGQVDVSGPAGYCIDASTLRRTANGGFAAIASCNILSGGRGPIVEPVLVTVTVSQAGVDAPDLVALASALGTELSRSRELSAVTAGRMASGGETAFQGSDPQHWRGTFMMGSRLVGLALYAPEGSPFVGNPGAAFLNVVSSRIQNNSLVTDPIAEQSQPET